MTDREFVSATGVPPARIPVAAIVPVAGRPRLVVEALDSIVSGSVLPEEVIVVVDSTGSDRRADEAAVNEFISRADDDPSIRVLFSEGIGAAGARNVGARTTDRPWLAFLDSDDLWHPEKLKRQWSYMLRRPHLHASQTGERWWKQGRFLTQPMRLRPRPGRFLRDAWQVCLVSLSSTLIRGEFFFELGGFDESFQACEDYELWLRFLSRAPFGLIPEPLVTKRSGDWSQLSADHSLDALRIRAILKNLRRHTLPEEEWARACQACSEKLKILRQGAARRGAPQRFDELAAEIEEVFGPEALSSVDFPLKK